MRLLPYLFLLFSPALWATTPPDSTAKQAPVQSSPSTQESPPELFCCFITEKMPHIRTAECEAIVDDSRRKKCTDSTMVRFVYSNLQYPKGCREIALEGLSVVSFVVTTEGKMEDLKLLKDIGWGTGAEALRVMELMRETYEWQPGESIDGKPVNVKMNFPIRFRISH